MQAAYKRICILFIIILRDVGRHRASPFPISPLPLLSGTASTFIGALKHIQMMQNNNNNKNNDENNNEEEVVHQIVSGWIGEEDDDKNYNTTNDELDDPLFDEYCSVFDDFGCEAFEDLAKNLDEKVYRWIRVEARQDETLQNIHTRKDVMDKIEQVRLHQENFGVSELYLRRWLPRQENQIRDNIKLQSSYPKIVNGDDPQESLASFSALQFNALAEGLSSGPDVKTPFPSIQDEKVGAGIGGSIKNSKQQKDQGYGGFSQVPYPEICLDFTLRRWRVLEVILGITSVCDTDVGEFTRKKNSDQFYEGIFDLMALEEIDRYRGFFAPLLRLFGYEGVFMPKGKAPGVQLGFYSDGCALFWKTHTFKLLSEKRMKYKLGSQIFIVATLKHLQTGLSIVVAVTHLKAQKSEANEKIRLMQVEELLGHVKDAARMVEETNGIENVPVLILGDFNADAPSEISYHDSSIKRILSNHCSGKEDCDRDKRLLKFISAYAVDPPDEGCYTTYKTRGTSTVKRMIDYIFYSGRLRCSERLSIPAVEELEESKLPGLRYPSDHLMIAAKFDITI